MSARTPHFVTRLAVTDEDLEAAQHLRYAVFVSELGGTGAMVDHDAQLERDRFDPHFDHLMLLDLSRDGGVRDQIVGIYRLLPQDRVPLVGQFYSEDEYDLGVLKASGRRLMELGRSCLHRDYRGGAAMFHLWTALSDYVAEREIEVLFGVASFHGTDPQALAAPLSLLHHRHLAPPDLRVRTVADAYERMDLIAEADLDRRRAMVEVPALIKGYLRLGGFVGDGAYVDHDFNTVDICLILDMARINETQGRIYRRGAA